jgi:hypothetical protein
VRFRLKQHRFIVDSDINGANGAGRRRPNRNSDGIYRDQQSGGQFRSSRTNNDRIAHGRHRGTDSIGTNHADGYTSARCFVYHDKPIPVPNWQHRRDDEHCGRLLNTLNRELELS